MTESPPGRRRQARERAIGFLYEAETKDVHPSEVLDSLPVPPDDFATEITLGTGDHRHQIDHLLDGVGRPKWPLARMAAMDRAVLRLGVYELAFQTDTPDAVILSEAADLATRYSTDDSPKFVNGVLARAAEMIRDEGVWATPSVLLLDCDGLFRLWKAEPIHEREASLGLEHGSLFREAFDPELYRQATIGELTAEEWGIEIARRIEPDATADRAQLVAEAWTMANWDVDEGFVSVIRRARESGRVRIAMLSNATTMLESDLVKMGVAGLLEVVVSSARIGLAKPDEAAYRKAAELVGEDVERILFVDDRAENVEGALATGLQAVLHSGDAGRFAAVLSRVGILDDQDPAS